MPESPQYGSKEYWEQRYAQDPSTFEWYQDYAGLRNIIRALIPLEARILQIGVGLSHLQVDMVEDGYTAITSIDISEVSIHELRKQHREYAQLAYYLADCRWMPEFGSNTYDAVLDKGTMDAILCGKDAAGSFANALAEIYRVLRVGGIFILITYGCPSHRLGHLRQNQQCPFQIVLYTLSRVRERNANDSAGSSASSDETELSSPEAAAASDFPVTRIVGPFDAGVMDLHEDMLMRIHSQRDHVHYMYVCTKLEAPPPPPPSPSCEDSSDHASSSLTAIC